MQNPKEFFTKQKAQIVATTENRLLEKTLDAIFESTRFFETTSNWLLLVTGGAVSLTIAHADSVAKVVPASALRGFILLAVVSGVFGFVSKYLHGLILIGKEMRKGGEAVAEEVLRKHQEDMKQVIEYEKTNGSVGPDIQLDSFVTKFVELFPKFFRKRLLSAMTMGMRPLHNHRRDIRKLLLQAFLVSAQVLALAAAVSWVGLAMKT